MIFVSAGEVSGDRYGADLARALQARRPDQALVGWGGPHMGGAGVELLADLTALSAVGVTENLPAVLPVSRALKAARAYLAANRPALVVLIDYQGANMALAAAARELGVPTAYYIAPQEWIWGFKGGLSKVARQVDLVLSIFELEAAAYRGAGARVTYVGHPLLDAVPPEGERERLAARLGLEPGGPVVGLFPGSRRQEVERLLPVLVGAARRIAAELPGARFLLPVAAGHLEAAVSAGTREAREAGLDLRVVRGEAGMALMGLTDVVLAASGTATLEAAVVGTPVVALYKVSPLTYALGRALVRTGHVTLPNIVAQAPVIPELLQGAANPTRLAGEALTLLRDPAARARMVADLAKVRAALGTPGAAARAAEAALELAGLLHPVPSAT